MSIKKMGVGVNRYETACYRNPSLKNQIDLNGQ